MEPRPARTQVWARSSVVFQIRVSRVNLENVPNQSQDKSYIAGIVLCRSTYPFPSLWLWFQYTLQPFP